MHMALFAQDLKVLAKKPLKSGLELAIGEMNHLISLVIGGDQGPRTGCTSPSVQ